MGIGRELARCFAADGHDLLLVARRLPALQALCAELEQRHQVKARAIACDLGSPGALAELLTEVSGLQLEYMVNNAGFGTCGAFAELAAEREAAMVELQRNRRGAAHASVSCRKCWRARAVGS